MRSSRESKQAYKGPLSRSCSWAGTRIWKSVRSPSPSGRDYEAAAAMPAKEEPPCARPLSARPLTPDEFGFPFHSKRKILKPPPGERS